MLQHAAQFARHPWVEVEARLADGHREAAGGAHRVVDHLGPHRQHGLLDVVFRHGAPPPLEKIAHMGQPALVQFESDARRLGRHLLGEVVHRGSQPPVDDHHAGPLSGLPEGLQQVRPVVAHGDSPPHREAVILQLLGHVGKIGIDDLAGEHLVTGADHFDAHDGFRVFIK